MLISAGLFHLFHTRWDLQYFSILIVHVDTLFFLIQIFKLFMFYSVYIYVSLIIHADTFLVIASTFCLFL